MLPLLLACGGSSDTPLMLTDADNHTATQDFDIPIVSVEPLTDWEINWSGVGSDLRCEKGLVAEPALTITKFKLTPAELTEKIISSSLKQADFLGFAEAELSGTCGVIHATDLGISGTQVTVEELQDGFIYLLTYTDKGSLTTATRYLSLAILDPEAGGQTTVMMEDGCGMMDASATFAEPVSIGAASRLDWSGLTLDALGTPMEPEVIDTLQVGYFSGLSPEDLEADYLTVESLVTQRWEIGVEGRTSISAEELADLDRFDVSDGNGTWLLGLWGGGISAMPRFLTVITE